MSLVAPILHQGRIQSLTSGHTLTWTGSLRMTLGLWLLASAITFGITPNLDAQQDPQSGDRNATRITNDLPADLWSRTQGEDWARFLGPDRNNKSAETGILTDWSDRRLRVVWQFPLQESYGMGVVSRGRFFQFDRRGDQAVLYCLHAETGEELWRYNDATQYYDMYGYNGGPRCSPLVDDDRVYLYGVDGVLACVDTKDGKERWKIDTMQRYNVQQNFFGVGSNPVIHNDLIIVMIGGTDANAEPTRRIDRLKPNGTAMVAFDKRTGKEIYRCGDDLASYASLQIAHVNDRDWCFAFLRNNLIVFDPNDGNIDFRFPWRARILESVNASTPVVVDDQIFISETYGPGSALLRIGREQTGDDASSASAPFEVVWQDDQRVRDKSMQTHWNTAIHHDGYLYGSSGRHEYDAELRCIELKSGKVMWSQPGLGRASLMYVDGHFVVLAERGELSLIQADPTKYAPVTRADLITEIPRKGQIQRRSLIQYPAWAAPILSHGLLYVRGDDYLICLELIPE